MSSTIAEPAIAQNPSPQASRNKIRRRWIAAALSVLLLYGLYVFHGRRENSRQVASKDSQSNVAVARVDREDLTEDIQLTAEFRPFQEIALHAKVAGYLKSITVDVGDQVKEGEKIAELEIPELEDDLARAQSAFLASKQDVERAEAEYTQTHVAFERLLAVSKQNSKLVAQQDLDNAKAREDAMKGALGAAGQRVDECQSELGKMKTMRDYASITIPFDGIITKRFADPGALIQAGTASDTQAMPLVELAQQSLLRLEFPVPESCVPLIRTGEPVEITVSSLGEKFKGVISRFSGNVDHSTRTMHTEVDVPNPDGRYKPGMYASVRLILHEQKHALTVPVQSLLTGEKPGVLVVTKAGLVEQRAVAIGLQTPDKVAIQSGVSEGDLVIVGSHSSVRPGQKAKAKLLAPLAAS